MRKDELLTSILAEHRKLEESLALLSPEQMEMTMPGQYWTIKETLAHLTSWEQHLLAEYARFSRGEAVRELSGWDEINAVNENTRKSGCARPAALVLEEFHKSFHDIVTWLEHVPEEELNRKFAYGMSLGEFTAEDTWKHYKEHLPLITG